MTLCLAGPSNKTAIVPGDVSLNGFARGTPPLRYQWYFNGYAMASQTNRSLQLANFSANNAGQYQMRASNHAGSIDSQPAELDLRVIKPPSVLVQPGYHSAWSGRHTTFRIVARGTRPFSYQWYHGGAVVPHGTNATLCIRNVTLDDEGGYWVAVFNEAGSVWSDSGHLTVVDPAKRAPQILRQSQRQTVRLGASAIFRVAAVGGRGLQYQWRHNGIDIPNAVDPLFILKNAASSDAGYYGVIIRNEAGEIPSLPMQLDILDRSRLRPEILSQPESQAVRMGTPIKLRVRASGTRPLTYRWYLNDFPLPGAADSTLSIDSAGREHAGMYRVVVQNQMGSALSLLTSVHVLYQDASPGSASPATPLRVVPAGSDSGRQ